MGTITNIAERKGGRWTIAWKWEGEYPATADERAEIDDWIASAESRKDRTDDEMAKTLIRVAQRRFGTHVRFYFSPAAFYFPITG